jgi:hypothetical protein
LEIMGASMRLDRGRPGHAGSHVRECAPPLG